MWWTIRSSGHGYLISIHHLHYSLHTVEVTTRMFLLVLSLSVAKMVVLFHICLFSLEDCLVNMQWLSHLLVHSYVEIQCVLKKVLT